MTVREETLKNEDIFLSELAMHCKDTKGRKRPEEECTIRTAYQRDRDRILHSSSFRRLKHKTQVFLAPTGDHYRTRLTHTLEVSQIARTIARAKRLNEDLTEAIALGHDIGHTPFGHAGERALNELVDGGFRHYEQSLRVVDVLEKDGKGLNLTYEVRNGILCHTEGKEADTLEGRLVKLSDHIAYINHDIDDAIHAGIISNEDIPEDVRLVLGQERGQRIDTMVHSVVENTDFEVRMSAEVKEAYDKLNDFMFENVYFNPVCKGEESKVKDIIEKLFNYYTDNPKQLPEEYREICEKESAVRAACDYIAGMSDYFALSIYSNLFIPKSWAE